MPNYILHVILQFPPHLVFSMQSILLFIDLKKICFTHKLLCFSSQGPTKDLHAHIFARVPQKQHTPPHTPPAYLPFPVYGEGRACLRLSKTNLRTLLDKTRPPSLASYTCSSPPGSPRKPYSRRSKLTIPTVPPQLHYLEL